MILAVDGFTTLLDNFIWADNMLRVNLCDIYATFPYFRTETEIEGHKFGIWIPPEEIRHI